MGNGEFLTDRATAGADDLVARSSRIDRLRLAHAARALILLIVVQPGRNLPRRPLAERAALGLAHRCRIVGVLHIVLLLRIVILVVLVPIRKHNSVTSRRLRRQNLLLLRHLVEGVLRNDSQPLLVATLMALFAWRCVVELEVLMALVAAWALLVGYVSEINCKLRRGVLRLSVG